MNKNEIMLSMSRSFNKVGFTLKKYSPEILIVTGVVGTVASAVMACKATLKVNEIAEEKKNNVEKINKAVELGVTEAGKDYSVEDSKNDLRTVNIQTCYKYAKLYAPAVFMGTLSLTAILASNGILRKRNVALGAAYAAIDKSFKEYRGRVVDRFGKEMDQELRYNIKAKEIEETVTKEDGTEETVKQTVGVVDPTTISDYAIIYDDGCTGWTKSPEANKMFLKAQERYANERLKMKGHLFLNEVYDMLGAPRTKAGQVVGWIYDEKHPTGDNFVDFGIFNTHREATRNFVNGYERTVLLDFNVDGNILKSM